MENHLQCTPIWPNYSLSPFHEPFLIPNQSSNLDNIASNLVVQDFDGLSNGHTSRKQFDHVSGFENDVRVVCLASRPYGHGTVNQVECAPYSLENTPMFLVHVDKSLNNTDLRACPEHALQRSIPPAGIFLGTLGITLQRRILR